VADPMSGFFAVRRAVYLHALDAGLSPVGYKIGLELLVKGAPARVKEVPIDFGPRRRGTSKLSLRQQLLYVEHVRRLMLWKWRHQPSALLFALLPCAFWTLVLVTLAGQLWYVSARELVPDEAYYWVWSRHLALSYFDHPPMVAYLIRASTAILGDTELAVRLP